MGKNQGKLSVHQNKETKYVSNYPFSLVSPSRQQGFCLDSQTSIKKTFQDCPNGVALLLPMTTM